MFPHPTRQTLAASVKHGFPLVRSFEFGICAAQEMQASIFARDKEGGSGNIKVLFNDPQDASADFDLGVFLEERGNAAVEHLHLSQR